MRRSLIICSVAMLGFGCARSSVLDVDSNTVQISTSAAVVCGQQGAQEVAQKRAAIETLKRGYDKYVIMGADYQNDVRVVGHTPVIANTYGSGTVTAYGNNAYLSGQSTTTYSGGAPIVGGHHNQQLMVRMFRVSDPGAENAIDARRVLGPEWQKAMDSSSMGTC